MNDLETQLHDSLHALADGGRSLSGPALRRTARRRTVRARTGGFAVVGAAAVAGVVIAPGLLDTPATRVTSAAGQSSAPVTTAPATTAAVASTAAAPVASVAPKASATVKPVESPAAPPAAAPGTWNPAGSLIDNATVLAEAPKAASTDKDWSAWSSAENYNEGPLLSADTVQVVYAGTADILSWGTPGPRPLVIVTGRASEKAPLQVAVLTPGLGSSDPTQLDALMVTAMHPAAVQGPQSIAVYNGVRVYVAAENGVDSATFSYTDNTGTHTAPMTVTDGVAVAAEPTLDLKSSPNGAITNVKAFSHGTVVWDAAPVAGR